jgi:peroxiredoxin
MHNKYDDAKLKIVGISLDTKEQNWRKAIAEHELTWPQLCNLDGGEDLKSAYSMPGIPFTLLVDKSGTVIVAGYPAQALVQLIDQLLNL